MNALPTLRPLTADDADALAAIWSAAWRASHAALGPAEIDRARTDIWYFRQARSFHGQGLAAVVGGGIAGFVTWSGAELTRLFVDPARPRVGVGAGLLAAAEFAMSRAGVERGWLHCRVGNEAARSFFARHGWGLAGTAEVGLRELPFRVTSWRMEKVL